MPAPESLKEKITKDKKIGWSTFDEMYDKLEVYVRNNMSSDPKKLAATIQSDGFFVDHSFQKVYYSVIYVQQYLKSESPSLDDDHAVVREICEEHGIPFNSVKHYWHKSDHVSLFASTGVDDFDKVEESFDRIVEKYADREFEQLVPVELEDEMACRVVMSDAHVGLDPDPNGRGLFRYEYNGDMFKHNVLTKVYDAILKERRTHGVFDVLFIDDLGDQQDGQKGETERGGHSLDQNHDGAEVFDICVDTWLTLIDNLVKQQVANRIVLRLVADSNHSYWLALYVAKAVKKFVNKFYRQDLVDVDIIYKFMEHRFYGKHCHILTHGKDHKIMNRGLPLTLDYKTISFINDYVDHYDLRDQAEFIHLDKGDLHQIGYQRTKRFDYRNFPSFSPPSNWVQHNFGDSYSGFSAQVIPKNSNDISHTDYFLNYEKIK